MAASDRPWRIQQGCVIVRVRLTLKSSKDTIDGLDATADGTALKARVRAIPEDGQANTAIERLLAEWLDVPKSTVRLAAGGKSRIKSLAVSGDVEGLEQRLSAKLALLKG